MNKKILCSLIFVLMIIPVVSASRSVENKEEIFIGKNSNVTFDDNNPPNPPIIQGPSSGIIGEIYSYTVTLTDPDEDDQMFFLEVDFGDGIQHEDCGCDRSWQNGTVLEISHQWKETGDYGIKARVQDGYGDWSEWSDPLLVSMPKNKETSNLFTFLLSRYLENFPLLEMALGILEYSSYIF